MAAGSSTMAAARMQVLPEVVKAVEGRAKVCVDGGFNRGSDIVKAIASGAELVGIGRLVLLRAGRGGGGGRRPRARDPGERGA